MKRISKDHEWIEVEGDGGTVGITVHAAEELGDITFVELPEVGQICAAGDVLGVVESVKAAADIYCPAGGEVCEVNEALEETPELINEGAETKGWICKLKNVAKDDLEQLMSPEDYQKFLQQ